MARLSISTSRDVKPPLLVDATQLEALDQIFGRYLGALRDYNNAQIASEASRRVRNYLRRGHLAEKDALVEEDKQRKEIAADYNHREERSVSIYLTKGKEIKAHSFSEALSQPVGDDEVATGFSSYVMVGPITAKVALGPDSWQNTLHIEVTPNDVELARSESFDQLSFPFGCNHDFYVRMFRARMYEMKRSDNASSA
jgi:hypothetical protein